jgi:hypothetical protein
VLRQKGSRLGGGRNVGVTFGPSRRRTAASSLLLRLGHAVRPRRHLSRLPRTTGGAREQSHVERGLPPQRLYDCTRYILVLILRLPQSTVFGHRRTQIETCDDALVRVSVSGVKAIMPTMANLMRAHRGHVYTRSSSAINTDPGNLWCSWMSAVMAACTLSRTCRGVVSGANVNGGPRYVLHTLYRVIGFT